MNTDLAAYYAQRAQEYERVYEKPERRPELARLAEILNSVFQGRDVLEIACGTGYWTQTIAHSAKSVVAIDCNPEVIEIARRKSYAACPVSFRVSDAYSLSNVAEEFTGGFCAFWWSHIPHSMLDGFLSVFHKRLRRNALVVMIDNNYVEESSTPVSRMDEKGNTYQIRELADGSVHEVLKNFPTEDQIRGRLRGVASEMEVLMLRYYWLLKYTVP